MTKQICKGRLKIVQRLDLWNIMKDRNQEKKIAARCFTICSSYKFRCLDSVVQGHAVLMRRKCIFFLWFSLFKRHFLDLQPNSHNWHWSNVPKPVRGTSSSISEHVFFKNMFKTDAWPWNKTLYLKSKPSWFALFLNKIELTKMQISIFRVAFRNVSRWARGGG